jgi:hypothetical protein
LFDLAAEGSDAESKCDWKCLGVEGLKLRTRLPKYRKIMTGF